VNAALAVREGELTPRQQQVLTAALELLVVMGDKLTMTAVARRASCSKETLYKWFGGRDGLLTATVQWQAAKVRVPQVDLARLTQPSLIHALEQFAANWLTVLAGEVSVVLNRLAVSHAGRDDGGLGAIVLQNGRYAMGQRLKPVLLAGKKAGLLDFEDSESAFRTFFGLVVRDVQIRLLLGDRLDMTPDEIDRDARQATEQFFALFGAGRRS